MILCTDVSTILAPLKCGTKGLIHTERTLTQAPVAPNSVWGSEFLDMLFHGEIPGYLQEVLTEYSLRNLSNLIFNKTDSKPFFLLIRNPETLYRAQIAQGFRQFCYDNSIFSNAYTFSNIEIDKKDDFFNKFAAMYPNMINTVFSNEHYTKQTFIEIPPLLYFLKDKRPDIYEKLFIVNLDSYPRDENTLSKLTELKVFDNSYLVEKAHAHSTKSTYVPAALLSTSVENLYKLPRKLNERGLETIRNLFPDKILTNDNVHLLHDL